MVTRVVPRLVSRETAATPNDFDVVVIGYGAAGASAAVAAADQGARVLLLEKSPRFGGNSLLSSGFMRVADDRQSAAEYLWTTSGGRVDEPLIVAFAEQMVDLPEYLRELARPFAGKVAARFRAELSEHEMTDLYGWPGRESIGWAGIESVPDFGGFTWASPSKGHNLMRILSAAVEQRGIDVRLACAATDLVVEDRQVVGVLARSRKGTIRLRTSAVVLATGGFEFDPIMVADNLSIPEIIPIGHACNTGDGIRLAAQAGAALWHMWHVHASYGFRPPDHPVGIRNHLGGSRRPGRAVPWIVVDQRGRRFMNEAPPAPQDTPWRSLGEFDVETGGFDRVPAWLIFDEAGRVKGPIGKAAWSKPANRYEWSSDNMAEIERGWIHSAQTIQELASLIGVDGAVLSHTVSSWNDSVRCRNDPLGRPSGTMVPIDQPPFFAIETWPVLSNTQGGPKHDANQRVVGMDGRPIPGLYAAGELGSIFGHIYMLGGNLTEAVMGGRVAGTNAARLARDTALSCLKSPS